MKSLGFCTLAALMLTGWDASAEEVGSALVAADSPGPATLAMAAGFVALGVFRARLRWAAQGRRHLSETASL
ncbi:hypothetical protein EP7_000526 [Isosphaeraceae bacterium EP7]